MSLLNLDMQSSGVMYVLLIGSFFQSCRNIYKVLNHISIIFKAGLYLYFASNFSDWMKTKDKYSGEVELVEQDPAHWKVRQVGTW